MTYMSEKRKFVLLRAKPGMCTYGAASIEKMEWMVSSAGRGELIPVDVFQFVWSKIINTIIFRKLN